VLRASLDKSVDLEELQRGSRERGARAPSERCAWDLSLRHTQGDPANNAAQDAVAAQPRTTRRVHKEIDLEELQRGSRERGARAPSKRCAWDLSLRHTQGDPANNAAQHAVAVQSRTTRRAR
jgi:hypothetical protein